MLNTIKTLKRNCKATLNRFSKKKIFDDDIQDEFFVSKQNFSV